jgi:hypothetical protein
MRSATPLLLLLALALAVAIAGVARLVFGVAFLFGLFGAAIGFAGTAAILLWYYLPAERERRATFRGVAAQPCPFCLAPLGMASLHAGVTPGRLEVISPAGPLTPALCVSCGARSNWAGSGERVRHEA